MVVVKEARRIRAASEWWWEVGIAGSGMSWRRPPTQPFSITEFESNKKQLHQQHADFRARPSMASP